MRIGIITFLGSTCDEDMHRILGGVLAQETVRLWYRESDLQGCEAVVLPGGFTYGDRSGAGVLAGRMPIMSAVKAFAERGGPVLGICNGFQILCQAGLLPGELRPNESGLFVCRNTCLRVEDNTPALTCRCTRGQVLKIPVAHGEGRFFADAATLKKLNENRQVLFRYCEAEGSISKAANFNGSVENIAGICNKKHNVFGMMPHPERAAETFAGSTDGRLLLESFCENAVKSI